MKRTPVVACMTFVLASAAASAGQLPPRDVGSNSGPSTGVIRGVVTAAETGQPIRGAEVRLAGGTQPNQRPHGAVADAAGRYEVTGLPAGKYTVTASKVGFVALAYGQTRVADVGTPVEVATGAVVEKIDFSLPRGAVIAVRIADEFGDPAPGYRVTALQPRFANGRRTLAAIASDAQHVTDDRGELRLSGLAPGEYYISATPPGVGSLAISPRAKDPNTFYPGTASETEAQPVTVALGEEIGVAFTLASARASRISGVIEGMPRGTLDVSMMRYSLGGNVRSSVTVAPDGSFSIPSLPPAEYVITARGENAIGMLRIRVAGEDVDGLVLAMKPQQPLRGRYSFDPQPPAAGPASLGSALRPITTDPGPVVVQPVAQVKNDWTFEIPYAMGSGVLRFDQPPRGWFLKAILLDGVDVIDTPLDFSALGGKTIDVRLSAQAPRVAGTVSDSRGQRATTYVAVVFPEDAKQWTPYSRGILAARPDQQGRYVVQGVPPGRYLLAVVEYLEPGAERDPATLERLRRNSTALTLRENESRTVDLKLTM